MSPHLPAPTMIISAAASLLTAVMLVVACSGGVETATTPSATPAQFPMSVQNCGEEISIAERPERVLTLSGEAAALVWASGAADRIVARAVEHGVSLGPAEEALKDVPVISPDAGLSFEAIIEQRPDVMIGYRPSTPSREQLAAEGIALLTITAYCRDSNPSGGGDFEYVYDDINLYGRLFGTEKEAATSVARLRDRVEAIRGQQFQGDAATIYLEGNTLYAYGSVSTADDQIEILGLTNVFGNVEKRLFETNIEELTARDPDVVTLLYEPRREAGTVDGVKEKFRNLPGIASVSAVKEDKLIALQTPYLVGSPLA